MVDLVNMTDLTIQGLLFSAPQPFAAGHVVSENEAHALNQVLAENLRNNFASKVKAAIEAGEVDKAALDKAFAEYAASYQFGVRAAGTGRTRIDPVEKEALKIAKATVRRAISEAGHKVSSYPAERIEELAKGFLNKTPAIYDTARENIARAKAQVGAGLSLDDLLA